MPADYFIGVHGRELERLKDQHAAWHPETRALWKNAGFRAGQHLADLGSGPGFNALDLAEVVGPSGKIAAVDKAFSYLDYLDEETRKRKIDNVYTIEADLTAVERIEGSFDGAFCRFLLAFLIDDLDRVVECIYRSLRPGGVLAAMEYLTLSSTSCSPPIRGFDAHTQAWVRYYLKNGGDTSIGEYLPERLARAGFDVSYASYAGGMAQPSHRWWTWWGRLMEDFGDKLAAGGLMTSADLQHLRHDWAELSRRPDAFIHTPLLIQLVARKA